MIGISEGIKGNSTINAQNLHSEFISFLVRAGGDYYIIPANGHGNIYSIVLKMIEAGYRTINFAIRKTFKDGKEELLFPDYQISEFIE